MLNIVMLCCMTLMQPIEAPRPKPVAHSFDKRVIAVHALAVGFDAATTIRFASYGNKYEEKDPLARVLVGRHPATARVIGLGAAEVAGEALLARKYRWARWLQYVSISVHIGCGAENLRLN